MVRETRSISASDHSMPPTWHFRHSWLNREPDIAAGHLSGSLGERPASGAIASCASAAVPCPTHDLRSAEQSRQHQNASHGKTKCTYITPLRGMPRPRVAGAFINRGLVDAETQHEARTRRRKRESGRHPHQSQAKAKIQRAKAPPWA